MSNYTKSFNFRNGVQVDDGNFVVNANGLVGIGTTRPEKRLDVHGNASVTGVTSLTGGAVISGILTVGVGITIDSTTGIISATKFVGDASGLQNIVAIATDGWIANAGSLSTVGKVGVGTLSPTSQLHVKGNSRLVGITTFEGSVKSQNINSSGIITATKFVGVSGAAAPFDNINVGTAATVGILTVNNTSRFNDEVRIPDNVRIKFGSFDDDFMTIGHESSNHNVIRSYAPNTSPERYLFIQSNNRVIISDTSAGTESAVFNVGAGVTLKHNNITKFETISTGATVTGDLGVSQRAIFNNIEVSGISTFNETLNLKKVSVGATVGFGKSIFMATNASVLLGESGNLQIFNSGTDSFIINNSGNLDIRSDNNITLYDNGGNKKSAEFDTDGSVNLFHNNVSKFQTITTGTKSFGEVQVARLNGGTNNLSTLYGSLRYGNEDSTLFPYSTRKSLDLLNYDRGDINFYLNANNTGLTQKPSFHWHYKLNGPIMSLIGGGNLGIGITLPLHPLHVAGIATVNNNLFVGENISAVGSITGSSLSGSLTGNVTGNLTGNVNANSGISTFFNIKVNEKNTQFSGIGIGKNCAVSNIIDAVGGDGLYSSRLFVTTDGNIGIMTDVIDDTININALQAKATFGSVGVGTTNPLSAIDFRYAGQDQPASLGNDQNGNPIPNPAYGRMYMYPPKITEAQKSSLVAVTNGAMIFVTDVGGGNNGELQVRIGGAWHKVNTTQIT